MATAKETKTVNTPVSSEVFNKEEMKEEHAKEVLRKYKSDEGIRCKSITSGALFMEGIKSHILYKWADLGDITEVEYQDLVAAIRSNSNFITKPYFIITDNEFLSQFQQVQKVYESMYSVNDLKDILRLSAREMKSVILSLPEGAKESIKHIASQMISNGQLDSVQKIKILDQIYDTKLMLMTELFDA